MRSFGRKQFDKDKIEKFGTEMFFYRAELAGFSLIGKLDTVKLIEIELG